MYLAKAKDYTHIVRHSSSSQQINSLDTHQEGAHKTATRHETTFVTIHSAVVYKTRRAAASQPSVDQ